MDFRHLIVTCLFSMLRLSFETQKIKENYAIFISKRTDFTWYYILYQANATYLYHNYSKIKMSLLIYTAIKLFEKINSTVLRNESIIFAKINDSKKIKI